MERSARRDVRVRVRRRALIYVYHCDARECSNPAHHSEGARST